ncbi:hypothetical protein HOG98_07990 [bacterium]|jgi:hypothetical protein|nr:hypothetical protein [bacterium]
MKDKKENKMKDTHKLLSPEEILNLSDSFGLNLDTQGGSTKENLVILSVEKPVIGSYKLEIKDESPIVFFDPNFFQKTVEMTEDSIKIKLFH